MRAVGTAFHTVEKCNVAGISVLRVLQAFSFALFLFDTYEAHKYSASKSSKVYSSIDLKFQDDIKRLRCERNIYIHALCFVLLLTLKRFITIQEEQSAKAAANAVSEPFHDTERKTATEKKND